MKILKKIIGALLLLLAVAFLVLYLYKDVLVKKVIANYNKNLNVTISYQDVDLNIFKRFPNANLTINDLTIINKKPINDTLFFAKSVYIAISIEELFKKENEIIRIDNVSLKEASLNLRVAKNGLENYDIRNLQKEELTSNKPVSEQKSSFTFDLQNYSLVNTNILYDNKINKVFLNLKNINHQGSGDFSASQTDLITKTTIDSLTVRAGNVTYFNKVNLKLNAIIGLDFENSKFAFKENKAIINDLDLVFNGFIDINDTNQEYDIKFHSPKAKFKSILSLIPSAYSSSFKNVTANGIANVKGEVKGFNSEKEFPKYAIHIKTTNASFKYPDLPKTMTNINFDGAIINKTKNNNVFLDIKDLKFTIDQDTFETKGMVTNLTSNPTVDASFKGVLNLENLRKTYPIKVDKDMAGVLKANFSLKADEKSIKNNQFDAIKTKGSASLTNFKYKNEDFANTIYIKDAGIKFNTNSILLNKFIAKTGKSDIDATGKIENLFAFLLDDKNLKGNFVIKATNFVVSDFLVADKEITTNKSSKKPEEISALKIPKFLDINTQINAKKVVYDNLVLEQVSGFMQLQNQKAVFKNVKASMLDGKFVFNGIVDTKQIPTLFDLDMDVAEFDIANSFNTLETFQKIVPVAKALKGKYSTSFKIKGDLNSDFSPNVNSFSGNALAELMVKSIDEKTLPLLNKLTSKINFIDFSKVNLKRLKTALSFKDGKVIVQPFKLKYQDITMNISGSHGFDKTLQYNLVMNVPAKYLGSEAATLLSKLTNINKDTIKIPLTTNITGTLLKPNVRVNTKQALTALTLKVIKYQKQELQNQATNVANDAINDVLSNVGLDSLFTSPKDTTVKGSKDVINDGIKEGINNVLGNIFGGKKKKDTIKKKK